jgi:iron-sulfur cluster assembly protein
MANIQATEAALNYIKKMLQKSQGAGFRLSIKKTGCSGYAYLPAIIDHINTTDVMVEMDGGVKIYLDSAWLFFLQDVHIDYVEDASGLKQKRLVFNNPQEDGKCGCGESFHVDNNVGKMSHVP